MNTTISMMNAVIAANPEDSAARLALADAITESVDGVGMVGYHPEMGEKKPLAHIEARLCHYGRHYYIDTPMTLKGRGIEFRRVRGDSEGRRAGWNEYRVTEKAFEKLETQYRVSVEMLL